VNDNARREVHAAETARYKAEALVIELQAEVAALRQALGTVRACLLFGEGALGPWLKGASPRNPGAVDGPELKRILDAALLDGAK
jgi:hypothetical protein